jgi:hypothetical protein
MADFAPHRTGQLVIRPRVPWKVWLWFAIANFTALGVLYGLHFWGQSAYSQRALSQKVRLLTSDNEQLRNQLEAAELARSVDRKAYAAVEKAVAEQQTRMRHQQEEIALYQAIISPKSTNAGLRIERCEVLRGEGDRHYRLRLVLVQSSQQDSMVSGEIKIELAGSRELTPTRVAVVPDISGQDSLAFSFRYFQSLEKDLELPQGFRPTTIDVEVNAPRQPAVRESFPWPARAAG